MSVDILFAPSRELWAYSCPIFIPTWGRNRVKTLSSIPPSLLSNVEIVVKDESEGRRLCSGTSARVLATDAQGKGISTIRQWLLGEAHRRGLPVCVMLDDDIRLSLASFSDGKKRFRIPQDLETLAPYFLSCIRKAALPTVGMTSFSWPFFNNGSDEWRQNQDNAATYFINVRAQELSGASFQIPVLNDRKYCLETLEAGFELWSNTVVAVTKVGKHGVGGECAIVGRGQRHEASIQILRDTYPRFVRLRKGGRAYQENYGTEVAATFYYRRMWQAVQRAEDVRAPL